MDNDSAPATLVGQVLGDRYRLTAVLGSGGMGSAYLATDEQMSERQVAVKVPHEEFVRVPGFRERFEHEVRQLIDLQHPNIVTILDSGETGGYPYAVLQYLGGGSLRDRLGNGEQMTASEVLAWLPAVAKSLDFIHRKGFLHRDIKPGNILFDTEGHPFVADFGISTALTGEGYSPVTQSGTILGSPAFMAPEYGTDKVGPAYDQYGLAVVVYLCLSGRLPHAPEPQPVAYLAKKMVEAAKPLKLLVPDIDKNMATALQRALATRPEARFTSCLEFSDAFRGVAAVGAVRDTTTGPATAYRLAAAPEPLAETVRFEDEEPRRVISTSVADQYEQAARQRAEHRQRAEARRRIETLREARRQHMASAPPERWPLLSKARQGIRNVFMWVLAFGVGFAILSEGSLALYGLINPLAWAPLDGGAAASMDQVASLVAAVALGNLLLGLLAGYTMGVICAENWRSACAALTAAAVAMTVWETASLGPIVTSGVLGEVSANAAWMSLAFVPLGLFAGGFQRERQARAPAWGGVLAAAAVVFVVVLARIFFTAGP